MEALSEKTVLLVTHQVDFLPAFDYVLVSLFFFSIKLILVVLQKNWHQLYNIDFDFLHFLD